MPPQVNRCAYCIAKHTKDARAVGESEQRLSLLSTWRDAPFYSQRERAALEWTEVLTLIANTHVPDEIYGQSDTSFHRRGTGKPHRCSWYYKCVESSHHQLWRANRLLSPLDNYQVIVGNKVLFTRFEFQSDFSYAFTFYKISCMLLTAACDYFH